VRSRRLIVILVVVLLVVAGGVGGDLVLRSQRLARQRDGYAAGLAAARQADCAKALALLSAARQGGSASVAANADRARRPCEDLQARQSQTQSQDATTAVFSWIGYLGGAPPEPFQAAARKAARTRLESAPLASIMTTSLCRERTELASDKILTATKADPLAADFLSGCALRQASSDPFEAQVLYGTLRTEFPKVADGPQGLKVLVGLVRSRLASEGKEGRFHLVPDGGIRSLHGKAQFVVNNGRTDALDLLITGRTTRRVTLAACTSCSKVTRAKQGLEQCDRKGSAQETITIPAGRYAAATVDPKSMKSLWAHRWVVEPNRRYTYCWWTSDSD
jgi:hypothetical protein